MIFLTPGRKKERKKEKGREELGLPHSYGGEGGFLWGRGKRKRGRDGFYGVIDMQEGGLVMRKILGMFHSYGMLTERTLK